MIHRQDHPCLSTLRPQSDLVDIGKVRKSEDEDEEPVILLHIILVVTNKLCIIIVVNIFACVSAFCDCDKLRDCFQPRQDD